MALLLIAAVAGKILGIVSWIRVDAPMLLEVLRGLGGIPAHDGLVEEVFAVVWFLQEPSAQVFP